MFFKFVIKSSLKKLDSFYGDIIGLFSLCFIIFMLLPLKKSLKRSHQLVRFFYFIFEYMVKEVTGWFNH
ncbi:hypothetical protein B8V78_01200 [Streptococcus agalactiae]|uniref:Uncharacterized protein n=1 Tax=Streptococcus agalactiae TaxID=1311 RepID=A0A3A6PTI9_STRAG|nr:hypothetical protein YM001_01065 [Streptococcus agalactiae]AYY64601.1 hypothetical protein EGX70_06975 [Streptococcus sp. FDAARGOS_522]AYY69495.1 hypothetical protein EGX72_11270 [Streptococcus sp. FDAARGOS_521]AYZ04774.1 hypothetical protein EGX96_06070 [Streptococcus sp. FDAARGOS_520]EIM69767.1 hypothetical protein WY5_09061 [Streptococcus agalactiae ZQ0910]EPT98902.1 hypothetical protein SAG0108_08145 [Streptococcus agalactiae BSU92]EPU64765.1 hypothetical protein SAG0306_02870 [Strepto